MQSSGRTNCHHTVGMIISLFFKTKYSDNVQWRSAHTRRQSLVIQVCSCEDDIDSDVRCEKCVSNCSSNTFHSIFYGRDNEELMSIGPELRGAFNKKPMSTENFKHVYPHIGRKAKPLRGIRLEQRNASRTRWKHSWPVGSPTCYQTHRPCEYDMEYSK